MEPDVLLAGVIFTAIIFTVFYFLLNSPDD